MCTHLHIEHHRNIFGRLLYICIYLTATLLLFFWFKNDLGNGDQRHTMIYQQQQSLLESTERNGGRRPITFIIYPKFIVIHHAQMTDVLLFVDKVLVSMQELLHKIRNLKGNQNISMLNVWKLIE